MFRVELTKGLGWDVPAVASREITDLRIVGAERFARFWFQKYLTQHPDSGVTSYRILDANGERVKASDGA
jgi:hypothetical protein